MAAKVDELQLKRDTQIFRLGNLLIKLNDIRSDVETYAVDGIIPYFYIELTSDIEGIINKINDQVNELKS